MRPGQHNKRGRNRNRHRGGGGGGNGNSANKVFDSNGPDVKLRGTAQTVAEKYLQLGRDAQASGDTVMAESYYQFADHYYRVWLAAQPAGQPVQFSRRLGEEDGEDEGVEGSSVEGDEEGQRETAEAEAGADGNGEAAEGERQAESQGEDGPGQQGYQNRPRRDFQQREGGRDQNREGGNRFRNRWGRRNDRYEGGSNAEGQGEGGERHGRQERFERQDRGGRGERAEREARPAHDNGNGQDPQEESGNWEAPSFLKRPMPAVEGASDENAAQERGPRGRGVRRETPSEDMP